MKLYFVLILSLLACWSSCYGELKSVKEVLRDGQGDFDPWNKERWDEWYNQEGEISRSFEIDTSVRFMKKEEPWILSFSESFSEEYSKKALFRLALQGITLDGNGIELDARTKELGLPLEDLYALKKEPWGEFTDKMGIVYDLPAKKNVGPCRILNFTFMGLKRGIKVNSPSSGDLEDEHHLIVEDCIFLRNKVGFYTNGYHTLLINCQLLENGYGGIYSGSGGRRNQFMYNTFRDNCLSQHQYSYADFIGDTFFDSEISHNTFLKSKIKSEFRRVGISLFRNMGEGGKLREEMPHNNLIFKNEFYGYSVGVNVGARMGRNTRNDVTGEGRDFAFYNTVQDNYFENTAIGIKINSEGNTVLENRFNDVAEPIVLHCVFFSLENTTINDQKGDAVKLWYVLNDYSEYKDWFAYQDDLNGGISKDEKYIEVFSHTGSPDFPDVDDAIFAVNPPSRGMLYDHRVGLPSDTALGEFSKAIPGKELVAIWDSPVAQVRDQVYYSIVIFDSRGTEINRCGLSNVRWKQIATGYFTRQEGEMQIAAVPAEAVEGRYPVFIFDRGYRIPTEIRHQDNTNPGISISTDSDYNLVVDLRGDE